MAGKRFAMIPESVFFSTAFPSLSGGAVKVLAVLWLHADHIANRCHPSLDMLAHVTGVHRGNVIRALNTLEATGFIRRVYRGGGRREGGTAKSSVYELIIPEGVDVRPLRPTTGQDSGPLTVAPARPLTVAPAHSNGSASATVNSSASACSTVAPALPKQHIEQHSIEQQINTSCLPTPERLRAEGNSAPAIEAGRQEEKITNPVIQRMGLNGPVVAQLASLPTPDAIALFLEAKADRRIKSLGGVLSHRAGNGHQIPPCTPKTLIEAVRAGIVHVVNGADLRRQKLTHDPGGLYAGIGTTETLIVATSDIRKAVIE